MSDAPPIEWKIFQLNEYEWWMAPSAEALMEEAVKCYELPWNEIGDDGDPPHEINGEALDKICVEGFEEWRDCEVVRSWNATLREVLAYYISVGPKIRPVAFSE